MSSARRIGRFVPIGLTLVFSGCYTDDHYGYCSYHCDDGYYGDSGNNPDGSIPACLSGVAAGSIDTGRYLELDPGYVAVSGEYFGDGAWRFALSCDTAQPSSGLPCNYDMTVSPVNGRIESFAPEGLEKGDFLGPALGTAGSDAVNLNAVTDYDIDAFTLNATPGSTLEVTLTLDGQCALSFFFWLENGVVVSDNQTLVDLTPSAP
jgi:hypothetical protein